MYKLKFVNYSITGQEMTGLVVFVFKHSKIVAHLGNFVISPNDTNIKHHPMKINSDDLYENQTITLVFSKNEKHVLLVLINKFIEQNVLVDMRYHEK